MAACVVVHLTASTFFGGPERQMLGLAENLGADYQTMFLSFAEGGRCQAFLDEARQRGFPAAALRYDTPHFASMIRELAARLRKLHAKVLCCHGYKATLLGRLAARRAGVPVVTVSRGWTGESLRVRLYEALERLGLRWMDRVVCVSEGQAQKVRRVGVRAPRALVIPNAIQAERFAPPAPRQRQRLQELFRAPRTRIVGAAGRLSPEKGFDVLVEAAARLLRNDPGLGFILFGDGSQREALTRHVAAAGISANFVLTGFRRDLDDLLPSLDLLVLPSFTEGMPNVVLEACAAGVPVVATTVGGTPEVIEEGVSGYLVPPGDAGGLATGIRDALASEERRRLLGQRGRERVLRDFTFAAQAGHYRRLFEELGAPPLRRSA
jgi:glycosyltransferase involved in cell wall biosynthesis